MIDVSRARGARAAQASRSVQVRCGATTPPPVVRPGGKRSRAAGPSLTHRDAVVLHRPPGICVDRRARDRRRGRAGHSQLPIAQYPRLAPPRVVITAAYPGASTETVDGDVGSIIEESLDGADGLQYYETSSDGHGNLEIDVTFAPGTDPDIALVDVNNRLKQVEPRLPQQVVQQGIGVFKAANTFLMLVTLTSTDGTRDSAQLGDYLNRYVLRELKRAPGVGSAQLWDADEALRVWLDPGKLREYDLGADDVIAAIGAQNATVTAGAIGDAPSVHGQH
jgi:HAE1 family hydrophobic/amphiphilic exporter-1